jgi:hypothetical protein
MLMISCRLQSPESTGNTSWALSCDREGGPNLYRVTLKDVRLSVVTELSEEVRRALETIMKAVLNHGKLLKSIFTPEALSVINAIEVVSVGDEFVSEFRLAPIDKEGKTVEVDSVRGLKFLCRGSILALAEGNGHPPSRSVRTYNR